MSRLPMLAATLAFGMMAWTSGAQAQTACASATTVATDKGPVCGTQQSVALNSGSVGLNVYQGIPYATPPTPQNGLRWQPSIPAASWSGTTLSATAFGSVCPQGSASNIKGSEDCLYLNVWTPTNAVANNSALPVMVFIHGGAFVFGAGSEPIYNGSYLAAANNQVVVTINYRLGALGFLYATKSPLDLPLSNPILGNFGLMDQQLALKWVAANIASFGGDPGKVTIFGESAGAMSVGLHLMDVPSSQGLFRAAIMESNPLGAIYKETDEAAKDGKGYQTHLCKIQPSACVPKMGFQNFTLDTVMKAQGAFSGSLSSLDRIIKGGMPEALPWTPVVDGSVILDQPINGFAKTMPVKPYLFGFNKDEGALFAGFASSLAGKKLNPTTYRGALNSMYGMGDAASIVKYTAGGTQPYSASAQSGTSYFSPSAQALNNVINDDTFRCGNTLSANANAGGVVAAYFFAAPPIFNPFPSSAACATSTGNVCHGAELPYVFNTLSLVATSIPPADAQLAQTMAAAWGGFAANPVVPANWTQWSKDGSFQVLGGTQNGQNVGGLPAASNCAALWYGVTPRQ